MRTRSPLRKRALPSSSSGAAYLDLGGELYKVNLMRPPALLPLALETALFLGAPVEVLGKTVEFAPGLQVLSLKAGFSADGVREYFCPPELGGRVLLLSNRTGASKAEGESTEAPAWVAKFRPGLLPAVLSPEVVAKGWMPPLGQSALPEALEKVVPEGFRYWAETSLEGARACRDDLASSGFLSSDVLKVVDGAIRRVSLSYRLYEPPADGSPVLGRLGSGDVLKMVTMAARQASSFRLGSPFEEVATGDVTSLEKAVEGLLSSPPAGGWIAKQEASSEAFALLAKLGPVLHIPTEEGSWLVASSAALPDPELFGASYVASFGEVTKGAEGPGPAGVPLPEKELLIKRWMGAKNDESSGEERYVLGVVLEPETIDKQADIYSPEEVRNAAHAYLTDYRTIGLMHRGEINDKVQILESYIAPCDFLVGEEPVKKGSWVMAVRVLDNSLWAAVKRGDLTGFSIGGSAVRKPVGNPDPAPSDGPRVD